MRQLPLFPDLARKDCAHPEQRAPVRTPVLRKGPYVEPTTSTSVYVVSETGDLIEGSRYALALAERHALAKSDGTEGSRQLDPAAVRALWVEPRIAAGGLLQFLDWNTWHARAVEVKALLVSGLGWRVERSGETVYDSTLQEGDTDDPAVRLLLHPSQDEPLLTIDGLLGRVLLDYYATGNAYVEVVTNRRGEVAELYHIPARTMRRGRERTVYWQVRGGRRKRFAAFGHGGRAGAKGGARSEVLHLYRYDPTSDYYGIPGWQGALATMGLDRTVLEFNTQLFSNALMAHLAVVVKGGKLSQAGREALKRFVREQATGVQNAGKILLIEDERDTLEVRFEKLTMEVKDLILKDVQAHFRDVVVGAHGVPPRLLGIATPGQLGAVGEVEGQLRTFRETVLRPAQRDVSALLGAVLGRTAAPGAVVRFAEMDVTNVSHDARLLGVLLEHGVYTGAEVRPVADRLLGL